MKKLIAVLALTLVSQLSFGQIDTTKEWFMLDTTSSFTIGEEHINSYTSIDENRNYFLDLDSINYLVPIKISDYINTVKKLNYNYVSIKDGEWKQEFNGITYTASICSFPDTKNYFYLFLAKK